MQEVWQTLREFLDDSTTWISLLCMGAIRPVKIQKRLTVAAAYETQRLKFTEDRILAEKNKTTIIKLEDRVNKLNQTQKVNLNDLHPSDDYVI